MSVLIRKLVCALFWLLWPVAAVANCADFQTIQREALAGYNIGTVQTGLRAALEDDNSQLRDGLLGRVTRNALAQLCARIPRAGDGDDVTQTLDLATDYGGLSAQVPEWRSLALRDARLSQLATSNSETGTALRLAAGPQMAAAVLTGAGPPQDCNALSSVSDVPQTTQTALDLLAGPERGYTILDICQTFPNAGTAEDFLSAMDRLGQMDLALPEAIDDLGSDQFGAWLTLAPGDRLPRLMGSPPAVLALLQEYQATQSVPPQIDDETPPKPQRPASCEVSPADSSTRFFAFSQANLDALTEPVDLQPAFDAVQEMRFANAARLWDALEAQLGPILDQCSLDQIEALVLGPEFLGRAFLIDEEATKSLSFQEDLQDVMPVVETFIGRIAPDEETLVSGLTAAITETVRTAIDEEVELAATTLASAAEPVAPVLDTLPEGVPEFDRPPLPETIGGHRRH